MSGAAAHVVRRLAVGVALLALLTLITFALYHSVANEPAGFLVDLRVASAEDIAAARERLGVDRPFLVQYADYVWRLLHGDLGFSWSQTDVTPDGELTGRPVGPTLLDGARVTGSVVAGGLAFLALVAVPAGILAARRPRGAADRLSAVLGTTALAIHPLVLALLLQLFLARRWHVLPEGGYCPLGGAPESDVVGRTATTGCGGPLDWAEHLLLPWVTFGLFFAALYMRLTRSRMLETLGEPYIRTARAKGAGELRVLAGHALRPGISPVVAMLGVDVGLAAGMSVYVETVFGLPGIGGLTVHSLNVEGIAFDFPLILGIVLLTGLVVVLANLLVDLAQLALDPRLRG